MKLVSEKTSAFFLIACLVKKIKGDQNTFMQKSIIAPF